MALVTFIIRSLWCCKVRKENLQVDSRTNIHAEESIRVHLKRVFVLFLREPVKSTITNLYELRTSTFTKTPTRLPIYMNRGLLLIHLIIPLKRKTKKFWAPGLSEEHPYLTKCKSQVRKLAVDSAVLIDVCCGICYILLAGRHLQFHTVPFNLIFEWQ